MSPAPAINDPGDSGDRDEVQPGDIPIANLMALVDSSSDEDDQEENVEPGIGYQLLTPGLDIQGPAGPGDSDDDDDDEGEGDGAGGDSDRGNDAEAAAEVEQMPCDDRKEDSAGAEVNGRAMPHLQVPPLGENSELKELQELWKTPRLDVEATAMDQGQVDTIKSAMAGFSLPSSSLPHWATVVPETEWKAQLLSRLGSGKCVGKLSDSKCKKSVGSSDAVLDKSHPLDSMEKNSEKSDTTAAPNGCDGGGLAQ